MCRLESASCCRRGDQNQVPASPQSGFGTCSTGILGTSDGGGVVTLLACHQTARGRLEKHPGWDLPQGIDWLYTGILQLVIASPKAASPCVRSAVKWSTVRAFLLN